MAGATTRTGQSLSDAERPGPMSRLSFRQSLGRSRRRGLRKPVFSTKNSSRPSAANWEANI
ncbi:MAG TPA: hypothetical protein DD417_05370 [Elusimicrobia bacterium]|nr:hypothetical protein [Elusimicrobiota bacterium]